MKSLINLIHKNALLASLLLHISILLVALFLFQNKKEDLQTHEKNIEVQIEIIQEQQTNGDILNNSNLHAENTIIHNDNKGINELATNIQNEVEVENPQDNIRNEIFINKPQRFNIDTPDINIFETPNNAIELPQNSFEELSEEQIYISRIQQTIHNNWDNSTLDYGNSCLITVLQNRQGYIEDFIIQDCDNLDIQNSIVEAIRITNKLPYQEDFRIFDPQINLFFIAN